MNRFELKKAVVHTVQKISCKLGNHVYSPSLERFSDARLWNNASDVIGVYRLETECIFCGEHYIGHAFVPMPFTTCENCEYYQESEILAPNRFCYRNYENNNGVKVGLNFSSGEYCSRGKRRQP